MKPVRLKLSRAELVSAVREGRERTSSSSHPFEALTLHKAALAGCEHVFDEMTHPLDSAHHFAPSPALKAKSSPMFQRTAVTLLMGLAALSLNACVSVIQPIASSDLPAAWSTSSSPTAKRPTPLQEPIMTRGNGSGIQTAYPPTEVLSVRCCS